MYNKYRNKKVIYDGFKFDSKREAKRWYELKLLEKANEITELERQKRFILQPSYINNHHKHIREISYIADFFYYDRKQKIYIVEDVKGIKTDVYKLKKKMFEYVYPNLTIEEI
jgi:hypothetical protein